MSFDLNQIRQLATAALGAAKLDGAASPAFTKVTSVLSTLMGGVPALSGDKVKLDAGLDDAIKGRQAASERVKDRFRPR